MESYNLVVETVLEKELYTVPPLMPVIVAKIVGSKQDIPKAFRITKDLASNVELKHLRRIKQDSINEEIECIICRCKSDGDNNNGFEDEIKEAEDKLKSENLFKDFHIAHVPSSAPKTDHQFKACASIWPCKFARSNYLVQCIEGSLLIEPEKLVLKIIVNSMINHIRSESSGTKTAAVVFRCAKVYGIGLSNSEIIEKNPSQHSTMLSIDSVAHQAGAGHWENCDKSLGLINSIQDNLDSVEELKEHRIDAHFLPYLCTNYDIFITEEPCIMCAMGLVQSRIRRLFYLDKESLNKITNCQPLCYPDQAIEEFLVHREKNLNHRFEAWKVTLIEKSDI